MIRVESKRKERERKRDKTKYIKKITKIFNNNVKSSHYNRLHAMNVFSAFDRDAIKYLSTEHRA